MPLLFISSVNGPWGTTPGNYLHYENDLKYVRIRYVLDV